MVNNMKYICVFLITLPLILLLFSCNELQRNSNSITKSKAVTLAKQEAVRRGCKIEDYRVRVVNDTNGELWKIYFNTKAQYPPPGSDYIVTVEKKTGHTVFMPGE